jgi:hypothetical protein
VPNHWSKERAAEVQRPQFFLPEASWNVEAITDQRLALLMKAKDSAPAASAVLVIDDRAIARIAALRITCRANI